MPRKKRVPPPPPEISVPMAEALATLRAAIAAQERRRARLDAIPTPAPVRVVGDWQFNVYFDAGLAWAASSLKGL